MKALIEEYHALLQRCGEGETAEDRIAARNALISHPLARWLYVSPMR